MPYLVSVKDAPYSARGDGVTDDRAAIQAALDSVPAGGGTVYVPPGDYRLSDSLNVTKDATTFKGAGFGASILRMADGVKKNAISLPEPYNAVIAPTLFVNNVTVSDLTVDGNHNPLVNSTQGDTDYFGVYASQTTNLVLERLYVKNWQSDGIAIANGNAANANTTVRNCRVDGCGRNGLHFGFLNGGTASGNYVTDCPSQYWGGSAANGIDVEVEGNNEPGTYPFTPALSPTSTPYVYSLTLSDNVIVRATATTAGDGVALQPAYGPVVGVTLSGNVIAGHQAAVESTGNLGLYGMPAGVNNVTVQNNWLSSTPSIAVAGNPLRLVGVDTLSITGNVANDNDPGNSNWSYYGFALVESAAHATVNNNTSYLHDQPTSLLYLAGVATLTATGNTYDTSVETNDQGGNTGLSVSGNTQISSAGVDKTAPSVSLSVSDGATLTAPTTVTVTATDAGAGVARVFFLINGLPQGYKSSAPYVWTVDPSLLQPGAHTLSAFAVDSAANLSAEVTVGFAVPLPDAVATPESLILGP